MASHKDKRWTTLTVLAGVAVGGALISCRIVSPNGMTETQKAWTMQTQQGEVNPLPVSEAEWKDVLTTEQFHVLRKKGTERAFTGRYWDEKSAGIYRCAGCGHALFSSDAKFDSGTGWPSFWQPLTEESVTLEEDRSWFSKRTEVVRSRCGGHLGHVFDDGPQPTGLRYCLNSAALQLDETTNPKPPQPKTE